MNWWSSRWRRRAKYAVWEWVRRQSYRLPYRALDYEEFFYRCLEFREHHREVGVFPRGHYYEFGLYRGSSFLQFHTALKLLEKRWCRSRPKGTGIHLFGFDSFAGLPAPEGSADAAPFWKEKSYACTQDEFQAILNAHGVPAGRVTLVPGFYEKSLTDALREQMRDRPPGIITIDCDYYSSTVTVLKWLRPLLIDGTFFLFDDLWSFLGHSEYGQLRAIAEFNRGGEGQLVPHHFGHESGQVYVYTTGWQGENYRRFRATAEAGR